MASLILLTVYLALLHCSWANATDCAEIATAPGGCDESVAAGACFSTISGVSWSCLQGDSDQTSCSSIPLPPPKNAEHYNGSCRFRPPKTTSIVTTQGPSSVSSSSAMSTSAPSRTTSTMNGVSRVPAGSPVAMHGHLQVQGSLILGEHGRPVRLRGMSLFWSQWGHAYWNGDVVDWLREDWHITLLRAAMGVEAGGYLENPMQEKAKLHRVVQAAVRKGIYVIIDWHDHAATAHVGQAKEFFTEMAKTYGHLPNVMFETFNEPIHQSWGQEIKPYHEQILSVIRPHSSNIVICGTPMWSQSVDEASRERVNAANVAYTLHFYAATHKGWLRDKAKAALNAGAALLVSEWGTCEASGNGRLDLAETHAWLDFLEEHHISDAAWAVNDKEEACSALLPGASSSGNWSEADLTDSGRFNRASLRRHERGGQRRLLDDFHYYREDTLSSAQHCTVLAFKSLLPMLVAAVF